MAEYAARALEEEGAFPVEEGGVAAASVLRTTALEEVRSEQKGSKKLRGFRKTAHFQLRVRFEAVAGEDVTAEAHAAGCSKSFLPADWMG